MIQDTITKILDSIEEDVYKSKFGAFYNLFVLPAAQILEPISNQILSTDRFQGLLAPDFLTEHELDVIASNFAVFRKSGTSGVGKIRIIVKENKDVSVEKATYLSVSINNKNYQFILNPLTLRASDFVKNTKYGAYYSTTSQIEVDIPQMPNLDYSEIPNNTILQSNTINDSNVLYCILESITTPATQAESNSSLYSRLIYSVGSKNMDNYNGVRSLFAEYFPDVYVAEVFGNTDPEVTRNQIYVYTENVSDVSHVLNFKGKVLGSEAVPHKAYEYSLTDSGDFSISGNKVVLNSYDNYLLDEASVSDYAGLQSKVGSDSFITGFSIILDSDKFVTDDNWIKSDGYLGYGETYTPYEITRSGEDYLLGHEPQTYDIYRFVSDLMSAKIITPVQLGEGTTLS